MMSNVSASAGIPSTSGPNIHEMISSALDRMEGLTGRLTDMTARLIGTVPEAAAKPPETPHFAGAMEMLHYKITQAESLLARLSQQV